MPTWKEQLQQIRALRNERKKRDAEFYALQIRDNDRQRVLERAKRMETAVPGNPDRIKHYRKSITELEAYLQQSAASLREVDGLAEKKATAQNRLEFLEKQLQLVKANKYRLQALKALPSHLIDVKSVAKPELTAAEKEKIAIRLEEERKQAKDALSQLSKQQDSAGERQAEINQEKENAQGKLKRLKEDLGKALRQKKPQGGETPAEPPGDSTEKTKKLLEKSKVDLHAAITALYADTSLRQAVENLPDPIPFLLLPIRIETRIVTSAATPELWLRVYPDDIAVHTHEAVLTDQEVEEGERYWTTLWEARKIAGSQGEAKKKSTWSYLAQKFGSQRAAWIARQTKPTNWDTEEAQPEFAPHDLTKTSSWSRAPRTNVLPDKFVVMLYEGETIIKQVEGNLIPDELEVGPDPLDAENSFVTKGKNLVFGKSFDWLSDFPTAIAKGMGFRIAITQAQAANGFDKILVLGLSLSMDETDAQKALEELLDNHHYSPKGLSLVPQGTPTNNADEAGSGYTTNDQFHSLSYYSDAGEALFKEGDNADGQILADALGIEYTTLQNVLHADGRDFEEAVSMNTALFPGTLGYYFDTMLDPVLSDSAKQDLRTFFTQNVTGRGPLPAIRVGDQPYGILLTSDFGNWRWSKLELTPQRGLLGSLFVTLQKYQAIWLGLLSKLIHVGKGDPDPSKVLMNILGLQAGSVSFRQRVAYSTDYLMNLDDFQFGNRYFDDLRKNFTSKGRTLSFLKALGYNEANPDGSLKVPQLLRLVYQHYDTELDAANLVDGVPLSEKDLIRYYDAAGKKNYVDWLSEARSIDALEKQDFGAGRSAPNTLLYLMLRRALLLQLHKASVGWLFRNSVDLRNTLKATNFYNIRSEPDPSKWEVMKAKVSLAAPLHEQRNKLVSEYLLTSGRDQTEAKVLNEVRAALKELSQLPTARLERCLTEHIDACTYRLDSWQTAMFGTRLKNDRVLVSEKGNQRRKGIYLGAYGWIENLRPAGKRQVVRDTVPEKLLPPNGEPQYEYADNGGFVHAPSLNQASAAAVLRSGYLSHATSDHPDTMCVNLTSERIRRALFILEGVRNGQTMEALLGYQFERGLHDAASADGTLIRLNEYIYDFRDKFPLEQHYLKQQGSDDPIQGIPAANVVNGVKLSDAGGDVPYGATGSVLTASDPEKAVIRKQKDLLADSLDAVKDLLLSESVYQLVQGNFDRASAVVNALKDVNIPPEMDIINTPRSSQFTFTNRVTLHFEVLDPELPVNNPWKPIPMSLRAQMEPGLNAWLAKLLGDPALLFCRVAEMNKDGSEVDNAQMRVDQLGLQPVDIIYLVGGELNTGTDQSGEENRTSASELELRIAWAYRASKGIDDVPLIRIEFLKPDDKETLGQRLPMLRMLKGMITDARALNARDFDPPSKTSPADTTNPEGYDVPELLGRVSSLLTSFEGLHAQTIGIPIDAVIKDKDGNGQHYFTLETAFAASLEAKSSFVEVPFTFTDADAATLQNLLSIAAGAGLRDAFPRVQVTNSNARKAALLDQARNIARAIATNVQQATKFLADAAATTDVAKQVQHIISAGKALLGDEFNIMPHFNYNNGEDIELSNGDRAQLLAHAKDVLQMPYPAEEWLANVGPVRPKIARWDYLLSLYEIFHGERLSIEPIQLPYRASDSWLAVEFPEKDPINTDQPFTILHDTLSITIHGDSAFSTTSSQSGLLLDDWTELIPTQDEISGITFNYDQPNAAPPQVLLLAVTPEKKGHWRWDALVGILNDTLLRAKLRAVEPQLLDELDFAEVGVLLPAILADFSQYDLNIALDYRMNLQYVAATAPVQAVSLTKT